MSYWVGVVREERTLARYYFTIHTQEGQLVMESDSYKSRRSATKGILTLKSALADKKGSVLVYETNNRYYFSVYARNGILLASSVGFASREQCEEEIETVKQLFQKRGISLDNRKSTSAKSIPLDSKVIDSLYSLDANKRESDRNGFRQWENEEFWFNKNDGIKSNFFARLMEFDK
ncbi:YegP family protein [Acetivibrio mesophilus]|uniref:DUF1508 domain-containing protein n=1 Tax=Acetivibrio mesophilus TaxID=2487273 RepID=A0A4Q0I677_9FIRM|nr:YegP family protein [Acetivibrio mesophilus]ODM25102.1 hypothetical protein A7W90_02055 [Clostridium sp. Bc-iso-3]RXE59894.1 DUF1508 domain-containing protein [Acetivibrio mesophilus]HHV29669.1 DUF1508 domain-containing protein [Clostridium sp.]